MKLLDACRQALGEAELVRRVGQVRQIRGQAIESAGPEAGIGELCRIASQAPGAAPVVAEVVGVRDGLLTLMPYGPVDGLAAGCEVVAQEGRRRSASAMRCWDG
jgi:flagellum-specific ATP synthase